MRTCAVLSKLFDVDASDFQMAPLSKGLSWATLLSNRDYRDFPETKQSKRELNQYLLEELIIPILYGGAPYLGFNPRPGWASLGLNLPLRIKNNPKKNCPSSSSHQRINNDLIKNMEESEENLQPQGLTKIFPIKLRNTMNEILAQTEGVS